MTNIRKLLAALLIAVSAPAWSYTQDLGEIDASDTEFSRAFIRFFGLGTPLGAFTDYYTFTIVGGDTAAGGTVTFELGFVDLSLNNVSLYKTEDMSLVSSDPTPDSFNFSTLSGGTSYTLAVSGDFKKTSWVDTGLAYYEGSIRSVASAAPEPGALALMLAGLFGVGLALRRRA